jgi:hypothetical protein
MDIAEAFQVVMDLARENQLDEREAQADPSLYAEYERQRDALNMAEDFIVNQLGDD